MTKEELDAVKQQLEEFKATLPKSLTEKEVDERVTEKFNDLTSGFAQKSDIERLEGILKEQGTVIGKMGKNMSEQTEKGVITKEKYEEIKKAFDASNKATFTINKVAAAFGSANAGDAATYFYGVEHIAGIQAAPREENVILPALLKGSTKARTIEWVNRINEDGGSAFIGEGVLKPLKDWDYDLESSTARKVAVRAKAPTEMLNDFAEFRSELDRMLRIDLLEKIESELLVSAASSTTLTGITTVASAYTTTALDDKVEMPNFVDAIRAGMLQMRLLNYKPDTVFINPTEGALLDLIKDKNGNYIKIQVEGVLRTLRVKETTSIPVGYFLLMDTAKWIVKMLEEISVEFGRDGDDFSKNMITVICEARMHSFYNSIDVGAFIYEDFATVISAIEKPEGV